jgi:hypothetical protein
MIGRCAGGHRKSRRTAGAIHRRNICGRLQLRGSFAATNIGEVVFIGTHGAGLVIASGVSYLLAGKNFVIWSVMACVEAPPASTRPMRGKAGRSVVSILNVRFAPIAVIARKSVFAE